MANQSMGAPQSLRAAAVQCIWCVTFCFVLLFYCYCGNGAKIAATAVLLDNHQHDPSWCVSPSLGTKMSMFDIHYPPWPVNESSNMLNSYRKASLAGRLSWDTRLCSCCCACVGVRISPHLQKGWCESIIHKVHAVYLNVKYVGFQIQCNSWNLRLATTLRLLHV